VDDGTAASCTTLTGLVELNQTTNNNWSDSGDIALTFASPVGTFNEANFEARLQYDLTGTAGADTITTGSLNDVISGGGGGDTLSGGAGNDTITGGIDSDTLSGGAGSDTFIYNTLSDGRDSISDFDKNAPGSGGDKLDISAVLDIPGNTWTDGGTLATAVAGGYVTFTKEVGTGGVQVNVDIDGSAGGAFASVALAVLTNVPFTTAAQAQTDLTDNIVLG
jgi:Ca2+-binding RTX toxin-like protein